MHPVFILECLERLNFLSTSRLSDLSNDLNTYKSADKTNALEESITQINTVLAALGKDVKTVQEQISQPDTTIISSHTIKLDGIATDVATLVEKGPAPVGLALSALSTKVSEKDEGLYNKI